MNTKPNTFPILILLGVMTLPLVTGSLTASVTTSMHGAPSTTNDDLKPWIMEHRAEYRRRRRALKFANRQYQDQLQAGEVTEDDKPDINTFRTVNPFFPERINRRVARRNAESKERRNRNRAIGLVPIVGLKNDKQVLRERLKAAAPSGWRARAAQGPGRLRNRVPRTSRRIQKSVRPFSTQNYYDN